MWHILLTLLYVVDPALSTLKHKKPTSHKANQVKDHKNRENKRQFIPVAPLMPSLNTMSGSCRASCQVDCKPDCDFKCCIPPTSPLSPPSRCAPYCPQHCYPDCSPKCCLGGQTSAPRTSTDKAKRPVPANCPRWCDPQCYPSCFYSCCMTHKARRLMRTSPSNLEFNLVPLEKINKYSHFGPHSLSPIIRSGELNPEMLQSSSRLMPLQTQHTAAPFCPPPCSKRCFPSCSQSCCSSMLGRPQNQLQPLSAYPQYPVPLPPEGFTDPSLPAPLPPMCPRQCSLDCYPECKGQCCAQRGLHPIIPPPQSQPILPNTIQPAQLTACSPTCSPTCFPACTPECCSAQQPQSKPPEVIVLIPRPPPVCPSSCPSTCYPQCEKSCCCQQTNEFNGLHPLEGSRAVGMCATD